MGLIIKKNKVTAYEKEKGIKEVVIPEGVTSIGSCAFEDCSSLTSITIPDSVTSIGSCAFWCCSSLTSITIPDSVTSIGSCAFRYCSSLMSVTIPDSVTSIGSCVFDGCESLTSITIPSGVTSIGGYAFSHCSSLTSMTIPSSVTSIGACAFYDCGKLKEIYLSSIASKKDLKIGGKKIAGEGMERHANIQMAIGKSVDVSDLNAKVDVPYYPLCRFTDLDLTKEDKAGILADLKAKCEKSPDWYVPYAAYADDVTVDELIKNIPVWMKGKKKDKEIALRVKGGLLLNDSISAMKYADSINKLDRYAEVHGSDADTLRDQVMSDFGLNEKGEKSWNVDGHAITARLLNDLSLSLTDETGKSLKSISKKTQEGKDAAADYAGLKKEIKSVAKLRNEKLFNDFLSGRERDADSWKDAWMANPLLKVLGRLIVWQQDDQTFTLHDDGQAYLADGTKYDITTDRIKVAHPMEMKKDDLEAWRSYFIDHQLKQPFEQVWEPVIESKTINKDRYKDCTIPLYMLMNKDKHGVVMLGQSELRLNDCSADLELKEGHHDWINNQFEITNFKLEKYTRQVNHIVNLFDKGTVEGRIKKDDITVSVYLDRFTLPQIMKFIDIAAENTCTNVSALLLEYKNTHFADYDVMDEFTLDL